MLGVFKLRRLNISVTSRKNSPILCCLNLCRITNGCVSTTYIQRVDRCSSIDCSRVNRLLVCRQIEHNRILRRSALANNGFTGCLRPQNQSFLNKASRLQCGKIKQCGKINSGIILTFFVKMKAKANDSNACWGHRIYPETLIWPKICAYTFLRYSSSYSHWKLFDIMK